MHSFILSCESTVDIPFSYVQERGIPVLFYAYTMNGAEHEDNMGRDPEALKAFYRDLNAGHFSQTSQINEIYRILRFAAAEGRSAAYRFRFGHDRIGTERLSRRG